MSNITNTDPVVTEAKLTEFYNDIKPFLGCPAYVTQEGDAEYFSTDEKVIGRWVNGKPLYQKTVAITIGSGVQSVVYSFPEANIEYLVDYSGYIYWTSAEILPIPWYSDGDWNISAKMSGNRDVIISTHGYNGKSGYITVIYTKTTDSAVTTIEQKPTHYSTDEQVVGYWIDGKPVYQRTYTTTVPNASSNGSYAYKTIAHNITNVDKFVDVRGTLTSSDFSSVLPFFTDGGNKTKFNINATDISIANDCVYSNGRDLILTVRYTKATD